MCTFYLRLTHGLKAYDTRIYIGFGLVVLTWLAVLFGILFGCGLPFETNWQIYPEPSNYCQPAVSRIDIYMTVVLNVLTDFYVMSIPLPLLWKARVSGFKRVAMVFCFSGGLFVTAAGILRCVLIVTVSYPVLPTNSPMCPDLSRYTTSLTITAFQTTNFPLEPNYKLRGPSDLGLLHVGRSERCPTGRLLGRARNLCGCGYDESSDA